MLTKLISDNYDIEVISAELLFSHFGTEIYVVHSNEGKYLAKTLPGYYNTDLESEGYLTNYLLENGVRVAKFLQTKSGMYHVKTDEVQFHVQEFIEGETLAINTAPDWFLDKSAQIIGTVNSVLRSYADMQVNFGSDFFTQANASERKMHYMNELQNATELLHISTLEERIKHLERIAKFDIQADKITYGNAHGDFHIGQTILKDGDITIIDWTSACKIPLALEVMTSYVYAAPECKDGSICSDGLKRYIEQYMKHSTLTDYDIKMMPYLFYYQQLMCHYDPPYADIPDTYRPICDHINAFTEWLCDNVEELSEAMQKA